MQTLLNDARHAVRVFRKAPLWTIGVAGTLAIGIGSVTAMFTIGNAVLLRPLPYPDANRLVMLWGRNPQKGLEQERVTLADFADWRARTRVFDEMGYSFLWPGSRTTIVKTSSPQAVQSALVSSGWLRALGIRPLRGRIFNSEDDRRGAPLVALISDRFWEQTYARDPSVLGRTLTVDSYDVKNFRIVGVMPSSLQFPAATDVWLSLGAAQFEPPPPGAAKRCCGWLEVIARVRRGISVEHAGSELNRIQGSLVAEHGPEDVNPAVRLVPLARHLTGNVRRAILILMAAVACVLLIACVNAANLLLTRAGLRRQEISVRNALGAPRSRIIRQLLTENILLSAAAGVGGLLLGWATLKVLAVMAPNLPRLNEVRPDAIFISICIATAALTGIGFGLVPALQWSGPSFVHGHSAIGRGRRLREILVVAEVALSTVLLVGAALLLRSLQHLDSVDPGFRPASVLTARIDMTSAAYSTSAAPGPNRPQLAFRRIVQEVSSLPGVRGAGGTNRLPLAGIVEGQGEVVAIEDAPSDRSLRGDSRAVTPDYFDAIGMKLISGRMFSEADTDLSEPVVIVDQTAARRYWPERDPLGRRMAAINPRFPAPVPRWMRVVGVVSDVRQGGLDVAPRPQFYMPYLRGEWRSPFLVLRVDGDAATLGPALRRQIASADPNAVVTDLRPMETLIEASTWQPRFRAQLLTSFSILALLLAAAGIYGVMSSTVEQRTPEIGLRIALGARASDIFRMVLGRGAILAIAGLAIGVDAALMLQSLIASLLFETSPTDPVALIAVAAVLLMAALSACLGPSLRAALLDPLVAIRHDS